MGRGDAKKGTPMSKLIYIKPERLSLKTTPELGEKWVQDRIAEDPSILGLGELVLKDKERIQPAAGRLDLLLQDPDTLRRYEVEIHLGKTDESHIIRTIEYWDIERKRYPQYDHCAVIVAEEITSRFLNVISLFNGAIPLIAIQMSALRVGEQIGLVFTTVLDELQRGLEEEDGDGNEGADRGYWEIKGSKATVVLADKVLEMIREFAPGLELKFNKIYIGLARDGQPDNFVIFRPKKNFIALEPRLKPNEQLSAELEDAGLDVMEYDKKWGRYRIRLTADELGTHRELVMKILKQAKEAAGE